MCIQYIIVWTLCGHCRIFDYITCEMGNQPLPPARCRNSGRVDDQIDFRRGLRCPDCVRIRAEIGHRQSALCVFNRQPIDASRNRGASLITEGLQGLAVVRLCHLMYYIRYTNGTVGRLQGSNREAGGSQGL